MHLEDRELVILGGTRVQGCQGIYNRLVSNSSLMCDVVSSAKPFTELLCASEPFLLMSIWRLSTPNWQMTVIWTSKPWRLLLSLTYEFCNLCTLHCYLQSMMFSNCNIQHALNCSDFCLRVYDSWNYCSFWCRFLWRRSSKILHWSVCLHASDSWLELHRTLCY